MLFSRLKAVLGGRVKFMIVGSAPLSPSTQEFIRTCLEIQLVQVDFPVKRRILFGFRVSA